MQERRPAHKSLVRCVVDRHAVDGREIARPIRIAGRGDAGHAAQCDQPVIGRRMGRQRAAVAGFGRLAGLACQLVFQPRLATQFVDQGDHGIAAVARARDVAQADTIGLELLVARIAT